MACHDAQETLHGGGGGERLIWAGKKTYAHKHIARTQIHATHQPINPLTHQHIHHNGMEQEGQG